MTDLRDIWRLDATAQAELVRSRQVSAIELVDAAIARIERLNPSVNAVVTPLYERARARALAFADFEAPFAGVPLLVKDASLEIEGTPYYIGLAALRDIGHTSSRTTELARRFERAGFIFMGKTACPELSSGITTEPRGFEPARNPWDLSRTTSGSSGGSAAAVACGMTSIAHGGDATGSLRYPAAACGVVTLKPTRGRMPHESCAGMPDPMSVWTEFVLTRSVRDLARVSDATAGATAQDLFALPHPGYRYADVMLQQPPRLRIGLMPDDLLLPADPACVAAVRRTGALLAELGHDVEESHPRALDGLWTRTAAFVAKSGIVMRRSQMTWLAGVLGRELTDDDLSIPIVTEEQAAAVSAVEFSEAQDALARDVLSLNAWWDDEGNDLLVTPTLRQPAWPLGSNGDVLDSGAFPAPWSFSGQPAMSLALHQSDTGLPVGVQIVAARGREDLLLQVAAQLEAAAPRAERWPPIAFEP